MTKQIALLSLIIITFISCVFKSNQKQSMGYVTISQCKYQFAKIDSNIPLHIIAFLGAESNDKENTYYSQFITIDEITGDTLRILTALISVDDNTAATKNIYTEASLFNPDKGILHATYQLEDSSAIGMMKQVLALQKDGNVAQMPPSSNFKTQDFVVVDTSFPVFINAHYITAVGVLHFKEVPW